MSEVSTSLLLWILTGTAAVILVGTRLRVRRENHGTSGGVVLAVHSVAGFGAVVMWALLLLLEDSVPLGDAIFGILAIALWWITGLAGILVALRWLPPSGPRDPQDRLTLVERAVGPWLTTLAHLGMVLIVVRFTWAYLDSQV